MKNLSSVLNVILLIAVAFLFFKVFSSNETSNESSSAFENGEEQNSLRIAYIDMDTLKATFSYYGELNDEMEKEMESAQQYLEQRQMRFQESYELFQQMAPSMSEEELAKNQQDLMNLQQQLVSVQQDLEQELMKKENDLLGELKS